MKILKLYSCLLYTIMWALLTACESFVTDIPEAKLPQAESKLVISSIISPQLTHINVIATESIPLFSKAETVGKRLENLTVKISDGIKEAIIPYDSENNLYSLEQSKFLIEASKTYTLFVSDGKRSVTAQCTVPSRSTVVESYAFDTLIIDNEPYNDTAITLKMTWRDIPADTNYYRINAITNLEYSFLAKEESGKFIEKRAVNPFRFNWDQQKLRDPLFSDSQRNGALFTSPTGKIHLPSVREETYSGKKFIVYPKTKIKSVVLEVFNVDQHYYKYHQSLEARNNVDNPFAEPSTVYSNVKGGFGCFAAYNAGQIRLTDFK